MMPESPEHNPPDARIAQCGSTRRHAAHWCAGLDDSEVERAGRRSSLAGVIHLSEHHADDCPGQCYATAERVIEALDGER